MAPNYTKWPKMIYNGSQLWKWPKMQKRAQICTKYTNKAQRDTK